MNSTTELPLAPSRTEMATEVEREIIRTIAERVRGEEEEYYRVDDNLPPRMVGVCKEVSLALLKELKAAGIPARTAFGMYMSCEESYPDLIDYAGNGVSPPDDLDDWDGTWTHWWVIYKDILVDLTADQFHPSDPESYRVVITDTGDSNYSTGCAWVRGGPGRS